MCCEFGIAGNKCNEERCGRPKDVMERNTYGDK
jgi:hypothetical protein